MFFPVEETADQVSDSEDCTMPEETEEQQQERNTEIRITVKEEEDELATSKQNTAQEKMTVKSRFKFKVLYCPTGRHLLCSKDSHTDRIQKGNNINKKSHN